MDLIYWSVHSSGRRGENGAKGVDVSIIQSNKMSICPFDALNLVNG